MPALNRRDRKSVQFNIRLPGDLAGEIRESALRQRTTATSVAARMIEEGVRMERFPGIDFRWAPSGRQPYLTGTGLTVWEVEMIWRHHDRDVAAALRNYPHLRAEQIRAAAAYARRYAAERPLPPPLPSTVQIVSV